MCNKSSTVEFVFFSFQKTERKIREICPSLIFPVWDRKTSELARFTIRIQQQNLGGSLGKRKENNSNLPKQFLFRIENLRTCQNFNQNSTAESGGIFFGFYRTGNQNKRHLSKSHFVRLGLKNRRNCQIYYQNSFAECIFLFGFSFPKNKENKRNLPKSHFFRLRPNTHPKLLDLQ